MGISIGKSCWSSPYAVPNSNPDPSLFKILKEELVNGYLILLVEYPNCTNFEGKKLMVYKGFNSSAALLKLNRGKLDPHFANSKGAPIARFSPTEESNKLISTMIGYRIRIV
jgi:hypothetical protein